MSRIIVNGRMVRHPLGGMNLYFLSYLAGLSRLGHEVFYVEKLNWHYGCHDLEQGTWTDNPDYGIRVLKEIFQQYNLGNNWCFVDVHKEYHGLGKPQVEEVFRTTDLFIELEWKEWEEESLQVPVRIFIDGEPGWSQINFRKMRDMQMEIPQFDHYFTTGLNIGTPASLAPDDELDWKTTLPPVLDGVFGEIDTSASASAPFTTVMNWRSNKVLEYQGVIYGQKAEAFADFMNLPRLTDANLEIAVSGKNIPFQQLKEHGWTVRDADDVAQSMKSYLQYLASSAGEFSVAKQVHSQLWSGWTGDRMAYYLQAGKPVIHQDTGFSAHLPVGKGLIAVKNAEEAAEAIKMVRMDSQIHAKAAREIAHAYFHAEKVLQKLLASCGL